MQPTPHWRCRAVRKQMQPSGRQVLFPRAPTGPGSTGDLETLRQVLLRNALDAAVLFELFPNGPRQLHGRGIQEGLDPRQVRQFGLPDAVSQLWTVASQ